MCGYCWAGECMGLGPLPLCVLLPMPTMLPLAPLFASAVLLVQLQCSQCLPPLSNTAPKLPWVWAYLFFPDVFFTKEQKCEN